LLTDKASAGACFTQPVAANNYNNQQNKGKNEYKSSKNNPLRSHGGLHFNDGKS
jgi:hypothetical protein